MTGDVHGDFSRFLDKTAKKIRKSDYLIICGDFGFIWNGGKYEQEILKKIGKFKFKTLFVDGTHENFDLLARYPQTNFCGALARNICGNLYHLPRGQVFELDGMKIFVFGGGESPDRELKAAVGNWWPDELPKIGELKAAVENLDKVNRKVDIIITHEPPGKLKNLLERSNKNLNILNKFFDDVTKEVAFERWFFGSAHVNKEFTNKYIAVFNKIIKV